MKIILLPILFVLSACSIMNMSKYNNNEHLLVNKIRTQAEINKSYCNDSIFMLPIAKEIYFSSVELRNFNNLLDYNKESINMSNELVNMSKGLFEKYSRDGDVSESFCVSKLNNIEEASKKIQHVIVRKPK